MSKVHKAVKKYSPGARLERAVGGDKLFDTLHPLGTMAEKQAAEKAAAKAAGKEAEAQAAELRKRQMEDLAALDEEENRRIKGLLVAGRYGTRGYRGSPLFRARPSNTAGVARTATAAGNTNPSSAALAAGGARGGLSRGGFRVSQV